MRIIKSEKEFRNIINENVTIIDFFADWCGPCKLFSTIFDNAEKYYKNVNFCKINIDKNRNISKKIGVISIPTTIIFKNGKEVKRYTGFMSEDSLKEFIEK